MTLPWVSICPRCNTRDRVYIYDSGYKFLRRLLLANNRFACHRCKITWRRWQPQLNLELQPSQHTKPHFLTTRMPHPQ